MVNFKCITQAFGYFKINRKKISFTNYNLILVSNNINEYITKNVDKVTVTLQFLLSMRLRIKQNQLDFYVCYCSYVFVIKLKHLQSNCK